MSQAEKILDGLGGWANIKDIEACITRIRVSVNDEGNIDEAALKEAGAFGVTTVGNSVQVIMGPQSEQLTADIEDLR